ncbi:Serine/threonine-protein kinase KIC1 [Hypsizygus marmoreus]|uniref:non-specific serine/threonine protein kinase n=1 Tax=Hypsizygus marmoreus TaxID=39966 RepID=A0A369JBQ5_HYPMA|nr:Serine/threonine-protein kinase KIC1 [Hypsizygus marmoreus]
MSSVHQLYRRLETIGKGAYGSVHKGEHIPSGNIVALKIINLDDKSGSDDVADIQREVALLTQLRDAPNITKYFGCYMDGPRVWIVMEYAHGGSVLSLMKASANACLEERYVSVIVREVLVALSYLHKVPVIHRDIKAANVLVTASGKVIICDFGVSALLATSSSKRNTLTGTPHWMAPEVLQSLPVYDTKADIWSLGILVYEMIKGGPPHANIMENVKVMDIIPKAKPPRLHESEAGKDLRDFLTMCLRESPAERLPAEELAKSKWIKSVSKVSVSTLKDLILRLEQVGRRASLAEPLDWEEEEERDLLQEDIEDENPWEFETVRGRSFPSTTRNDDGAPDAESESLPSQSTTIRSPQAAALPSSLRLLFEDEAATSQENLRLPVFPIPPNPGTPSPPGSLSSSMSSSPARERVAMKRALTLDNIEDEGTAKQPTFVYPRRGGTRSRSKLSSSVPGSEDEGLLSSAELKFPHSPRPQPTPSPDSSSANLSEIKNGLSEVLSDLRPTRGPPDIDVSSPPLQGRAKDLKSPSPSVGPTPVSSNSSSDIPTPTGIRSVNRKRSQTTAEGLASPRSGLTPMQDLDLASPAAFQFPPSPKPSIPSDPSTSTLPPQRSHNRNSPNHLSASIPTSSSTAHQATYSLDTSASTRRIPTHSPLLPPSITRTRSATVLPATTHPVADGSGPRKGIPQEPVPLIPPMKPFARTTRNRSGSDLSQGAAPGLKDVLKIPSLTSEHHLGISDLLPPSPSAAIYTPRSHLASPSQQTTPVAHSNLELNRHHPTLRDGTSFTSPSISSASRRSPSPPAPRRIATESPFSSSFADRRHGHARKTSTNTSTSMPLLGPPVRQLDYSRLISEDNTHAELARTIDDLTQWLSVVEVGLNGMLEKEYADTIEEEQEVSSDLEAEDSTLASNASLTRTDSPFRKTNLGEDG